MRLVLQCLCDLMDSAQHFQGQSQNVWFVLFSEILCGSKKKTIHGHNCTLEFTSVADWEVSSIFYRCIVKHTFPVLVVWWRQKIANEDSEFRPQFPKFPQEGVTWSHWCPKIVTRKKFNFGPKPWFICKNHWAVGTKGNLTLDPPHWKTQSIPHTQNNLGKHCSGMCKALLPSAYPNIQPALLGLRRSRRDRESLSGGSVLISHRGSCDRDHSAHSCARAPSTDRFTLTQISRAPDSSKTIWKLRRVIERERETETETEGETLRKKKQKEREQVLWEKGKTKKIVFTIC